MLHSFLIDCIYTYADLLTLGLFFGGALYLLRLVIRPKNAPWYSLGQQLEQPCWLFGSWLPEKRQALAPWLFVAAAALYQFEIFFVNSLYRDRLPWLYEYGTLVLDHLAVLCLLGKILLCTRYSGRQLAAGFGVLFIFRWVFMNNHNKWLILAVLFALAAKDVSLRKALKTCFAVAAASVSVVAVSSLAGIIETVQEVGTGRYRNSFGYGWYNFFGACLLAIALMYVCLRQLDRLRWFDFAVLAGLAALSNFGPDSRAATVCILLLFAGLLVLRLWPKIAGVLPVQILLALSPLLAFGASLALAFAWDPGKGWMAGLNGLLSGRLELGWQALTSMPLRIAGQMPSGEMLVDNAYLYHWITSGPVASLLIWAGFGLLVWRLLRQGRYTEAVCGLAMVCHAMMENHVVWACVNITIWLLAGVIFWPKKQPSFALETEKPNGKRERIL